MKDKTHRRFQTACRLVLCLLPLGLAGCENVFGPWRNPVDPYSQYRATLVASTDTTAGALGEIGGLTVIPEKGVVCHVPGSGRGNVYEYDLSGSNWSSATAPDLSVLGSTGNLKWGADGCWYGIGGRITVDRFNPTTLVTTSMYTTTKRIYGFAVTSAGTLYVSVPADHKIYQITSAGVVSTYAGTGTQGSPGNGDGGSAVTANLCGPGKLALAPDDSLYFEDFENFTPNSTNPDSDPALERVRLRRISAAGILTTVGFNGNRETNDDGYPAIEARTSASSGHGMLNGLAVAPDGTVIFADGETMFAIPADGNIYIIAGSFRRSGYPIKPSPDWATTSWDFAADIIFSLSKDGTANSTIGQIEIDGTTGTIFVVNRTVDNTNQSRIIALTKR